MVANSVSLVVITSFHHCYKESVTGSRGLGRAYLSDIFGGKSISIEQVTLFIMGVCVDKRDDAGIGEAETTSECWPDDRDEQRMARARQEHLRTAGGTSQPQGLPGC